MPAIAGLILSLKLKLNLNLNLNFSRPPSLMTLYEQYTSTTF